MSSFRMNMTASRVSKHKHSTKASRAAARASRLSKKDTTNPLPSLPLLPSVQTVPAVQTVPTVSPLFSQLPCDIHMNENFTLDENEAWYENDDTSTNKTTEHIDTYSNEINKFINEFAVFQYENDIGIISENMDPNKWIEVDTFLFKYIYKLSCENKIKQVICDYGISKGLVKLFEFYKKDLCIGNLQQDLDIINYMSNQSDGCINTDMVLAILRDTIGFTSYKGILCDE